MGQRYEGDPFLTLMLGLKLFVKLEIYRSMDFLGTILQRRIYE